MPPYRWVKFHPLKHFNRAQEPMDSFNGFEPQKQLLFSRALIDEVGPFDCSFQSLQGLDAFFCHALRLESKNLALFFHPEISQASKRHIIHKRIFEPEHPSATFLDKSSRSYWITIAVLKTSTISGRAPSTSEISAISAPWLYLF